MMSRSHAPGFATCSNVPWLACIGEASNGLEAVALIDRLTPDLVVLDIQEPPGLLGTDVLQRCVHRPHVIFTTAYSEHAVTASRAWRARLRAQLPWRRALERTNRARLALGEPGASGAEHTMDRLGDALSKDRCAACSYAVRPGSRSMSTRCLGLNRVGTYVAAHTATSRHVVHVAL